MPAVALAYRGGPMGGIWKATSGSSGGALDAAGGATSAPGPVPHAATSAAEAMASETDIDGEEFRVIGGSSRGAAAS